MTGWIAHEEPFAFARGPIRLAEGARRFAQGTPPVPGLYSAVAGLEIVEEVGVSSIAAESRRRTQALVDFALEHGLPLRSPAAWAERGASVMVASTDPERLVEELAARRIFTDARPGRRAPLATLLQHGRLRSKRPRRPCWSCSTPAFFDCRRSAFSCYTPEIFAVSKRFWRPILQGGVERMPRFFGALVVFIAIAGVACSTDNPSGATCHSDTRPYPNA